MLRFFGVNFEYFGKYLCKRFDKYHVCFHPDQNHTSYTGLMLVIFCADILTGLGNLTVISLLRHWIVFAFTPSLWAGPLLLGSGLFVWINASSTGTSWSSWSTDTLQCTGNRVGVVFRDSGEESQPQLIYIPVNPYIFGQYFSQPIGVYVRLGSSINPWKYLLIFVKICIFYRVCMILLCNVSRISSPINIDSSAFLLSTNINPPQ